MVLHESAWEKETQGALLGRLCRGSVSLWTQDLENLNVGLNLWPFDINIWPLEYPIVSYWRGKQVDDSWIALHRCEEKYKFM